MTTFKIDYFELMMLAENCIPPSPIARSMFFDNLTDKYYKLMTYEQRKGMFNFITKKENFSLSNIHCSIFYDRYNPDNQYLVKAKKENINTEAEAFFRNGDYWININTYIPKEYITNIKKIEYNVISIT